MGAGVGVAAACAIAVLAWAPRAALAQGDVPFLGFESPGGPIWESSGACAPFQILVGPPPEPNLGFVEFEEYGVEAQRFFDLATCEFGFQLVYPPGRTRLQVEVLWNGEVAELSSRAFGAIAQRVRVGGDRALDLTVLSEVGPFQSSATLETEAEFGCEGGTTDLRLRSAVSLYGAGKIDLRGQSDNIAVTLTPLEHDPLDCTPEP